MVLTVKPAEGEAGIREKWRDVFAGITVAFSELQMETELGHGWL